MKGEDNKKFEKKGAWRVEMDVGGESVYKRKTVRGRVISR